MIRLSVPFVTGKECEYAGQALRSGHLSGDGDFTEVCSGLLAERFGFRKSFLVTSGTHALEMAALLAEIRPGDEVIMPSFTFVSTANAFALRGARIVFADSMADHPNLDHSQLECLVTDKTKAIIPMHYAGVACEMNSIRAIADKYNLFVIEDAAHSIGSYFNEKPLGTIGDFGTLSFHDSKNITCGEGGLLSVNNEKYYNRAEVIREKGTNRSSFLRGGSKKYEWMDIGSSYLLSDVLAAVLLAQIEAFDTIQEKRLGIWKRYHEGLDSIRSCGYLLPFLPGYATNNAHIYYIICPSSEKRDALIVHLRSKEITAAFHYMPLHKSPYFRNSGNAGYTLPHAERYGNCLVRLPIYPSLTPEEQELIIETVIKFAV